MTSFLSYEDNVLILELSANNRDNVFENRLGRPSELAG